MIVVITEPAGQDGADVGDPPEPPIQPTKPVFDMVPVAEASLASPANERANVKKTTTKALANFC